MEDFQLLNNFQSATNSPVNFDGQLELAFELQKTFNQLLEDSIQDMDEDSVKTLFKRSAEDSPVQRVYQVVNGKLVQGRVEASYEFICSVWCLNLDRC